MIHTQICRGQVNWSWEHYHDVGYPGTKCLPRNRIYDKRTTNSYYKLVRKKNIVTRKVLQGFLKGILT